MEAAVCSHLLRTKFDIDKNPGSATKHNKRSIKVSQNIESNAMTAIIDSLAFTRLEALCGLNTDKMQYHLPYFILTNLICR